MRHRAEGGQVAIDKAGIDLAVAEACRAAERRQKSEVGAHAGDERVIERIGKPMQSDVAARRVRDQLGDHRIVEGRDLAALCDAAVDADVGGQLQPDDPAGRGQKAVGRILGIKARLDGMTSERDLLLGQRQLVAGGDLKLPGDEIKPGNFLRYRVLDLQPRVHFDEPEAIVAQSAASISDELDGTGADIADRARSFDRRSSHSGAQPLAHSGRRRFFDHLLVAPLQRAVTLAEMDDVAVAIGKDLDLDVARRRNEFFDQHAPGAEGGGDLTHGTGKLGLEIALVVDPPQPAAAAAGGRLDQHRIADRAGTLFQELRILAFAMVAGNDRHAGFFHQRLGAILQPHGADRRRGRADEGEAGLLAGVGEVAAFGQEAVAGMHALRARHSGRVDQTLDVEVALARLRRADEVGLVAQPPMQRMLVGRREHRDGSHSEPLGGAGDAAGDFAAIGNQDGLEHCELMTGRMMCGALTGCAAAAQRRH